MSARQKKNNLWNLIIILSLLPLIKSHSDASGLNFNKSFEHDGSNLLNFSHESGKKILQNNNCSKINNSINSGDEFNFKFDFFLLLWKVKLVAETMLHCTVV